MEPGAYMLDCSERFGRRRTDLGGIIGVPMAYPAPLLIHWEWHPCNTPGRIINLQHASGHDLEKGKYKKFKLLRLHRSAVGLGRFGSRFWVHYHSL
jgi:hypothetical protein